MKKLVTILLILLIPVVQAADDRGTITVTIQEGNCILNFKQGWNLFSFCSELQNTNLLNIFSSIEGKYRYVMKWNLTKQEFDIYSPRAIEKPFSTLDDNESYFIYALEPIKLDVPGVQAGAETRNLVRGWSTPSYPYRFTTLITNMIIEIQENLRYLMKWNTINQEFDIYSKRAIIKPFYDINIGEGQFIYMENSDILNYPGR